MKESFNHSILTVGVIGILTLATTAQFTISLPKIPTVKTSKPSKPATNDGQSNDTGPVSAPSLVDQDQCATNVKLHLKNLATTRDQAAEYRPGLRDYYVQDFNDRQNIYLKAALSQARRKTWLENWPAENAQCMQAPLDDLAVVARKTLPSYHPTAFAIRNPAEEKVLRTGVNDLAQATVFKVAFRQAAWKIDKDSYNFPTARYKNGIIWAKYSTTDDGFCRIIHVNLIQDYAGGGTYGESYAKFIASEYAGCPAGK